MHARDGGPIVEFLFSPGSRYSYLAATQLSRLEAETGCRVVWRPVHGPELRARRGHDPFAGEPVSGQYEWPYRRRDAERWAAWYDVPYRDPPSHDFDGRLLARAAVAGARLGQPSFGGRLATALYGTGAWPVDEALCVRVAGEAGLERADFLAALADPETERTLAVTAADAHRRGAFGVPTFFLGDELFWGNDRLVLLRAALLRRAGEAPVSRIGTAELFENARVKVWDFALEPGAAMPMHTHHRDHVIVVVEGGRLEVTYGDGRRLAYTPAPGDVHWGAVDGGPADTHDARNVGTTRYRNLIVELKEPRRNA